MSKGIKPKKSLPKRRNGFALAASMRKGGPMKDRRTPRGGAKNEQSNISDLVSEYNIPDDQCRFCFLLKSEIKEGDISEFCFSSEDDKHHFGEDMGDEDE